MNNPLKIVADENMPALDTMFNGFSVTRVAGRTMSAKDVETADVLLVRSVTQVNEALLSRAKHLKMVGTATIGMDHLDQAYLLDRGIPFFNAPGCNAEAVVDYVLAAIHNLLPEDFPLRGLTVGIIGAGNVGGRLQKRLNLAGVNTLVCDPPRALAEGEEGFTRLDTLLSKSDVVCLHTPLTTVGSFATYHLLGEAELRLLKPGAVLINAGRGPVVDNQALSRVMDQRNDLIVALDVWEHEPSVDKDLVDKVALGSPHIAGYSLDGKLRGTYMLRERLSELLGIAAPPPLRELLPLAPISSVTVTESASVLDVISVVYSVVSDDRRFRRSLSAVNQAASFDLLRKNYPVRREFSTLTVNGVVDPYKRQLLSAFGFNLSPVSTYVPSE